MSKASKQAVAARQAAIELALTFPEAWQDEPWEGDVVVKVRKKIFMFAGADPSDERWPVGIGVKLPVSKDEALATTPGAALSGYGLGKWGWVTIPLDQGPVDAELIRDWIEESYRAIAPKTLAARLDTAPEDHA
ncbi:MAG: MmcQ/YjbR family DNA-binding protein [Geodermatophilaceae bacterium]|nr:MmcQ/YjbR family DNA-binding protein [Geodermatophilaceae bacterium]